MVFRVPDHFSVYVIQLYDVSVIEGVHADGVDVIQLPAPLEAVVLAADILYNIFPPHHAQLRDVFLKFPVDEPVGKQTDEAHGSQQGQQYG